MTLTKLLNQAIGGGVLLLSVSVASQAQAMTINYEDSYFIYNGHQYSLTKIDTWTGAQSQAVAKGGNLVTINDATEESWLISTFGTSLYWIGFNDVATEGTFEWVNGEPVTYTNWSSSEPNDAQSEGNSFQGEDFTVMNWLGQQQWNDLANTDSFWSPNRGIVEQPVPEPLTMLGAGTALGFGSFFKRKLAKDKKSNKA